MEEERMTVQALDQAKIDAFGRTMADALNGAGIALMASIGHQTGLFDTGRFGSLESLGAIKAVEEE